MLQELSGNRHLVVTGVSVTTRTEQLSFSSRTDVFSSIYQMKRLNSTWTRISHSIKRELTDSGVDRVHGIERIEGSFYNVMGLPIQKLYETLRKLQFQ